MWCTHHRKPCKKPCWCHVTFLEVRNMFLRLPCQRFPTTVCKTWCCTVYFVKMHLCSGCTRSHFDSWDALKDIWNNFLTFFTNTQSYSKGFLIYLAWLTFWNKTKVSQEEQIAKVNSSSCSQDAWCLLLILGTSRELYCLFERNLLEKENFLPGITFPTYITPAITT